MRTVAVTPTSQPERSGIRHACRAEGAKLFSVRSTSWTLLVTVVGTLLVTALSLSSAAHHNSAWYRGFDPTNQSLSGLYIGALALGLLGALVFTSEYGSGTIRSSMAATPRRVEFLVAKLLVVAAVAGTVGESLALACFGLGHVILHSSPLPTWSLTSRGVLRTVLGTGAAMGLLGMMGAAIGAAVRRTAGAVGLYVTVLFLLPLVLTKVPGDLTRFTPLVLIADSVASVVRQPGFLGPAVAMVLLVGYTAALVLLGGLVLVRRDP